MLKILSTTKERTSCERYDIPWSDWIRFDDFHPLQVAQELIVNFKDEINSYLNLVVNKTQNDLGKCGPLSNVYKSVHVAACNRIVNPWVSSTRGTRHIGSISFSSWKRSANRMDSGPVSLLAF